MIFINSGKNWDHIKRYNFLSKKKTNMLHIKRMLKQMECVLNKNVGYLCVENENAFQKIKIKNKRKKLRKNSMIWNDMRILVMNASLGIHEPRNNCFIGASHAKGARLFTFSPTQHPKSPPELRDKSIYEINAQSASQRHFLV